MVHEPADRLVLCLGLRTDQDDTAVLRVYLVDDPSRRRPASKPSAGQWRIVQRTAQAEAELAVPEQMNHVSPAQ
ncbi:hypothetical protein [Streptomyces sp. NPDC005374]|uniref:hypothetical protein n=1 Tax=Streptomyces sp. NPDC005374 TaxID=3364713 RepID=UPI00369B8701